MNLLTLIPARAGSRGLKNKNLRKLDGVPLLVRAIDLARQSQRRADSGAIVVSTESDSMARLARRAGAEVPFKRPRRLATSTARLIDVVLHAVDHLEAAGRHFDAVVLLSAATPLTTPADLRRALRLFRSGGGVSVASVVYDPVPESWRFEVTQGRLQAAEHRRIGRRQEADRPFRLNGAIFIGSPGWIRQHRQFVVPGHSLAVKMPRQRSVDIEDRVDLALAQVLLQDQNRRER